MRNIISGKYSLLRIFLAFAVFMPVAVSCEFSGGNVPGGGYGFPYADFEVTGTVIDDLNQPVQGIRVWYEDTMCGVCYCDTAPDGTFVIEGIFYALAPERAQAMMRELINLDPDMLRKAGLIVAFIGVIFIIILRGPQ